MHRPRFAALLAFVALALSLTALADPLAAQELASGTWTGTIAPPDGQMMDVEFTVDGEAPAITMSLMGELVTFEDIEVTDGALHFSFDVGTFVVCELLAMDEGGYEGECLGDDGESGVLTMIPPM